MFLYICPEIVDWLRFKYDFKFEMKDNLFYKIKFEFTDNLIKRPLIN